MIKKNNIQVPSEISPIGISNFSDRHFADYLYVQKVCHEPTETIFNNFHLTNINISIPDVYTGLSNLDIIKLQGPMVYQQFF